MIEKWQRVHPTLENNKLKILTSCRTENADRHAYMLQNFLQQNRFGASTGTWRKSLTSKMVFSSQKMVG
jgi:hypothetical protein